MLCIQSQSTDPFFNLAAEEYLLKNFDDDIFMLWSGIPSIIVGKHQNTLGEINYQYIKENRITVARRLSGGGTVFHDEGNLNFTWILNGEKGKLVDFKKFIDPIIAFLKSIEIDAQYGGRNDIHVNSKKISGNAEHVFRSRTLHHGTLLLNANLDHLRNSLRIIEGRYIDKAVKSVPHSVENLFSFMENPRDVKQFSEDLFNFIQNNFNESQDYQFNKTDIIAIDKLISTKFNTWDWNFGYSPKYKFQKDLILNGTSLHLEIDIVKGTITNTSIKHLRDKYLKETLINALTNCLHEEKSLHESLERYKPVLKLYNIDIKAFINELF